MSAAQSDCAAFFRFIPGFLWLRSTKTAQKCPKLHNAIVLSDPNLFAKAVGLTGMRLHDLRHTVVTYMLDAGESPRTVQEFVGHADPGFMLRQYAHVLEKSKKQASDALMRNLFGQSV